MARTIVGLSISVSLLLALCSCNTMNKDITQMIQATAQARYLYGGSATLSIVDDITSPYFGARKFTIEYKSSSPIAE